MTVKRWLPFLGVLLLAGCDGGAPTTSTAPSPPAATAASSDFGNTAWGHLEFKITGVYQNQHPTEEFPGHADGGVWTFLDCVAGNARFVVGLQADSPVASAVGNDTPPADAATRGHAVLRTEDPATTDAFLAAFAGSFHTDVPEPLSPRPLHPQVFNTSITGTMLNRAPSGSGFVLGGGGTWTATRWFVSTPRLQAEVFFNFDLATRQGEFAEKNIGDREDLIALWSRILRDGSRGMRSPQEDRNVVPTGPHLGAATQISGPYAGRPFFVPGGEWLFYTTNEPGKPVQLWQVQCAQPQNRRMVIELPVIYQVQCADPAGNHILVEEKISDIPGMVTSADPSRFIWLDLTTPSARVINGPWNPRDVDCDPEAISPDSRFLVVSESRTKLDGKGGYTEIYIVNLQANTASSVDINHQWLQPFGWHNTGDNLRLVARTGLSLDPPDKREPCLIDPNTGDWAAASTAEVSPLIAPLLPSPDGQNIAAVVDRQRLEIRRVTGVTRQLIFNPEDRQFVDEKAVAWLDNQYLSFFNPYPIIIDTRIMKMNYLLASDKSPEDVRYSPDFRYAVVVTGDGMFLAPIEIPHR